jgi:hypothetical protein
MNDELTAAYQERKRRSTERAKETLAKAHRSSGATARSAWERDYSGAIGEALKGRTSRLIDLLRARRPLTDDDYERLADYVERTTRGPGKPRNEAAWDAAVLARSLLDKADALFDKAGRPLTRDEIVAFACSAVERTTGTRVGPEKVHDRLNRGRKRRR